MPRKRMIDPSFWSDEKLGECTRDERLLFMGLISNADDEGYGRANPKLLRSSIFPYDDLRVSDLEKWLSRLGGLQLIALYEVKGQTYYYLPNFTKHQTINKPVKSAIPKPVGIEKDQMTGDYGRTTVVLPEDYRSATVALPPKRNRREKNTPIPPMGGELPPKGACIPDRGNEMFGRFWSSYPRKTAKQNALRAFEKLNVTEALLTEMLAALDWQRHSEEWTKEGGRFVPYPATWLNQRRWEDERTVDLPPDGPAYLDEYL